MIELLVVIAVISVLVSILLPSLNKAKDLARGVMCTSNMRQWGIATTMFSNDQQGYLPVHQVHPEWKVWDRSLASYVNTEKAMQDGRPTDLLQCPSDQFADDDPRSRSYSASRISKVSARSDFGVVWMPEFAADDPGYPSRPQVSDILNPSNLIYLSEWHKVDNRQWRPTQAVIDHYLGKYWPSKGPEHPYHAGGVGFLFVDGHAGLHHPDAVSSNPHASVTITRQ